MVTSAESSRYIDIELSLDRKYFGAAVPTQEIEYEIEFRGSLPECAEDIRRVSSSSFDYETLKEKIHDPRVYGASLSQSLFQPEIRETLGDVRAIARSQNMPIRMRLLIMPEAAVCTSSTGRRCAIRRMGNPCSPPTRTCPSRATC